MTAAVAQSPHDVAQPARTDPSRKVLWTGRVLSALAVAFLTFDTVFKLAALLWAGLLLRNSRIRAAFL